jgi:hypothetical protein
VVKNQPEDEDEPDVDDGDEYADELMVEPEELDELDPDEPEVMPDMYASSDCDCSMALSIAVNSAVSAAFWFAR